MTPTATAPDPTIFSEDVRRFAAERSVTDYLVPLYELAKRHFPGADVTVTFESDYEIPDLHWIVYEVTGGDVAGASDRTAYYRLIDETLRIVPPSASGWFATRVR